MSKAFTRESENAADETFVPPLQPQLPPGVKNYITAGGARRLREELDKLTGERSELASRASDDAAKRRIQWIEARAAYIDQSLRTAVVVPTPAAPHDRVRFGATVKVREANGAETEYRIVGVDETDLDQNWISFFSPIARALMNQPLAARVRFRIPAGEQSLEIVGIRYTE